MVKTLFLTPIYRLLYGAFEAAWWTHAIVQAVYHSASTNASWWTPPPKGSARDRIERVLGWTLPPICAAAVGLNFLQIVLALSQIRSELLLFMGDWLILQIMSLL